MAASHRCQFCRHKPGFRVTTPLAKVKDNETPRAKKAPCGCKCHVPVGDYPLLA